MHPPMCLHKIFATLSSDEFNFAHKKAGPLSNLCFFAAILSYVFYFAADKIFIISSTTEFIET